MTVNTKGRSAEQTRSTLPSPAGSRSVLDHRPMSKEMLVCVLKAKRAFKSSKWKPSPAFVKREAPIAAAFRRYRRPQRKPPTPGDYSGYAEPEALFRQQRGRGLAIPMSLATLHEIPQEATPLLSAGLSNTQGSLDKPTTPPAIRAPAPLPPQDGVTQRPLGGVVRRLDALMPHER